MKEIIQKVKELEALVKENPNVINIEIHPRRGSNILVSDITRIADLSAPISSVTHINNEYGDWQRVSSYIDGVEIETWIKKEADKEEILVFGDGAKSILGKAPTAEEDAYAS